MDRVAMANFIADRLQDERDRLRKQFIEHVTIPTFVLDNTLPENVALTIHRAFPNCTSMSLKSSIRERKFVSAQMNRHNPVLEEAVYAFQQPSVVRVISDITGMDDLEPDKNLYAGGISAMPIGSYLKPHLDNSHDSKQEKYRAINLLYYVTPNWHDEYGGNLELWDTGPKGKPRTIGSTFNRLVLMATNRTSWHSVSSVSHSGVRCCISNYYFSSAPPGGEQYFHATSFRGRPEEPVRDLIMRADNLLRTAVLKLTGTRVYKNPHIYRHEMRK